MRPGRLGGLVTSGFVVVGAFGMVFVRAFGDRGDGWDDIREFVPLLVGVLAGSVILIVGFTVYSTARDRHLARRYPGAEVFTVDLTPNLKRTLRSTPDKRAPARTPGIFTVVGSVEGLSFWVGWPLAPNKFWQLDWREVADLQPALFPLKYKTVRGIRVVTHDSAVVVELAPYQFRAFTVTWDESQIDALITAMQRQRAARVG